MHEAKQVLDSWVRYEGQVKQRQQRELAQFVIARVSKELENPKIQQQILNQSITDVESEYYHTQLKNRANEVMQRSWRQKSNEVNTGCDLVSALPYYSFYDMQILILSEHQSTYLNISLRIYMPAIVLLPPDMIR